MADYDDDEPPEIIYGDEDMLKAWSIFTAMLTQWRSSGAGAYGLDYNVLPMMFKIYGVKDEELALNDVRTLEQKALEMMAYMNK